MHAEWFWAGAFSFAISSMYLQAQELTCIREVVGVCLGQFARYVTGVGISGAVAGWMDA